MGNNKEYILRKITEIRKIRGEKLLNNIYSIPDDIEQFYENENGISFLINDKGVNRVYFISNKPESLHELLEDYPEGTGIEIIGRDLDEAMEVALRESGYEPFEIFLRASNTKLIETYDQRIPEKYEGIDCLQYVQNAETKHADEIYNLLWETFTPLVSHLQDKEQLKEQILQERIVVSKENGVLTALLTYEFQGKKLYMEHAVNHGSGILMHSLYFTTLKKAADVGINYVYTWMREDNVRALGFARRYGIVPDGIKNFIYQKK